MELHLVYGKAGLPLEVPDEAIVLVAACADGLPDHGGYAEFLRREAVRRRAS
jgi:hypothetical protein